MSGGPRRPASGDGRSGPTKRLAELQGTSPAWRADCVG